MVFLQSEDTLKTHALYVFAPPAYVGNPVPQFFIADQLYDMITKNTHVVVIMSV